MIYEKIYFWIALIPVVIIYLFASKSKKEFPLLRIFPSYLHFLVTFLSACFVAVNFNSNYQIYCKPVFWTTCTLIVIASWTLVLPVLKEIKPVHGLLSGLTAFVCIYLILFGGGQYLGFILFSSIIFIPAFILSMFLNRKTKSRKFGFLNLYGIAVLLPYIALFAVIKLAIASHKTVRYSFFILPLIIITLSIFTANRMSTISEEVTLSKYDTSLLNQYTQNPLDKYLLELALGAHWKYHTRICLLDGRRPPFHDPTLVMSYNFAKFTGGMPSIFPDLDKGKALYKYAFPQRPIEFDCNCAKNDRWPREL